MEQILASRTISITELKRNPSAVIEQAGEEVIAVLNHNKPAAYLLSAATYDSLLEKIEVASIREAIAASGNDPRDPLSAKQVFDELDAEFKKLNGRKFGQVTRFRFATWALIGFLSPAEQWNLVSTFALKYVIRLRCRAKEVM